ncbi:hypothetical protein OESDEN_09477 [Oesophagostomum dentatum]|uniref:DOMON domain-containing protein n=1 Tax=Oesophagostomum dentatum TaxID=61180 RepID=A0A0B1T5N9_OESDE|nr:hypothetical protein OESDEN_09477 [Oesophagostomum dentatum]
MCIVTAVNLSSVIFREGCGTTKACLFKPAGCDPNLDCTIGLIFFVVGPNKLRIEMVATTLIPAVPQQYIAIAFSNDPGDDFVTECVLSDMGQFAGWEPEIYVSFNHGKSNDRVYLNDGDDFVTECVLSDMGQFAGWEPEIFVSFNHGKSNDRVYLNDDEHKTMISNVTSQVIDGRLVCQFTQQIIPQIDRKNGLIWDLNKSYYIMGATGSAQPDEVNAHDMNRGSHFYPIVSSAKINPSQLSVIKYDMPLNTNVISKEPAVRQSTTTAPVSTTTKVSTKAVPQEQENSSSTIILSLAVLLAIFRLL